MRLMCSHRLNAPCPFAKICRAELYLYILTHVTASVFKDAKQSMHCFSVSEYSVAHDFIIYYLHLKG